MHNGKHASHNANANGHSSHLPATSPTAPMKSVKLVLRQKTAAPKRTQDEPPGTPLDVLEKELPPRAAFTDQVPLADIVDRLVQDAYSKLVELSDTLPGTAPQDRPRDIEAYATETRKKFLKAYVLSKWAKSAYDVETSMAVTAYLEDHGERIDQAIEHLASIKSLIAGARLRNADISTALTVLTQLPSQQKSLLPTVIRDQYAVTKPMTAAEIRETFTSLNDVIRTRLRLWEFVPLEWSDYTVENGRVYFTAKDLFKASFSLTGPEASDQWYIIDMEFLIGVAGSAQERFLSVFPRKPPPHLWQQIMPGVNNELAKNVLELPENQLGDAAGSTESAAAAAAAKPKEPVPVPTVELVDAPLIRAYNLLQMLSLSYQLEILTHQAQVLRSLGWAEYLNMAVSRDRQSMHLRYWMRSPSHHVVRPNSSAAHLAPLPPHGGLITINIAKTADRLSRRTSSPSTSASLSAPGPPSSSSHPHTPQTKPTNSHANRYARELDQRFTLEAIKRARRTASSSTSTAPANSGTGTQPSVEQSDFVEDVVLETLWEPTPNVLGVALPPGLADTEPREITIESGALDCETIIKTATRRHARLILMYWQDRIQGEHWRKFLASRDGAVIVDDGDTPTLQLQLFQDLTLFLSIDLRTGKLILRDAGDLAAWERGYRFARYTRTLNENPHHILEVIQSLRFVTILESVELQVSYIGLQSVRTLLPPSELQKLGEMSPGYLFINLTTFPAYYLVVIVTIEGFKYALISTARDFVERQNRLVVRDIGWLDPEKLGLGRTPNECAFAVRPEVLREMYAFACARVSHTIVEQQLKTRAIPYASIFPSQTWDFAQGGGQRNRAVPVLRILARDLWPNSAGRAEEEGVCQNVKMSVMNWWNERPPQIVTECKLKSPPPLSLTSSHSRNQAVSGPGLRPNSLVSYDPKTSIVSFFSSDVDVIIDELQGEWDRVQKTLAIARHVSNMSRLKRFEDVRLLSFNLLTIEFTYLSDFVVTIEYIPSALLLQPSLLPTGSFKASFSRLLPAPEDPKAPSSSIHVETDDASLLNPHQEIASFLSPRLIEANGDETRQAVQEFVLLLRSTLPVLLELDSIRQNAALARRKSLARPKVSILYKSGAWFRILYGQQYALDVRILANRQIAVLDGTCSLFQTPQSASAPRPPLLSPIPRLEELVNTAISSLRLETPSHGLGVDPSLPTTLYSVGRGIRCSDALARQATRRLHECVLESLIEQS